MATPVTGANFQIITGWGSGASISAISGTQRRCKFTITAGVGPTINPKFAFIYPDGPYPLEPGILAKIIGGTGQFSDLSYSPDVANTIFTYTDLPSAGATYIFSLDTIGI